MVGQIKPLLPPLVFYPYLVMSGPSGGGALGAPENGLDGAHPDRRPPGLRWAGVVGPHYTGQVHGSGHEARIWLVPSLGGESCLTHWHSCPLEVCPVWGWSPSLHVPQPGGAAGGACAQFAFPQPTGTSSTLSSTAHSTMLPSHPAQTPSSGTLSARVRPMDPSGRACNPPWSPAPLGT